MNAALIGIGLAVILLVVLLAVLLRKRGRADAPAVEPEPAPAVDAASPKPAGWYADPADDTQVRWWDGSAWTQHLQDKPEV